MSQQLVPINGGIQEVQTTVFQQGLTVLSPQYIQVNGLEGRPTQWVLGGRPIYRRLPGTSETYQIDFFNIAPARNTAVAVEYEEIGYVYIPWGAPETGANTLKVSLSESKKDLLISNGTIVWKYGNTEVLPVIESLPIVEVLPGSYELAYQLIYDDSPIQKLYEVKDFALTGQPLTITSSTDSIIGWRYTPLNAFLNSSDRFWANKDTFFPSYAQPTQSFIQWTSTLASSYSKIVLRCPANTAYSGTATLNYYDGNNYTLVKEVEIGRDSDGQFFEFNIDPRFQTGWQVVFSSLDVSIQSILVSGVVTLVEKQAAQSSRATLVMYPIGTSPKTVKNADGIVVPATYCSLAYLDVGPGYQVDRLEDTRFIIKRDYQPVSDWLTLPFDENLIDFYEQVSNYPSFWMAPPSCLKQEYASLTKNQIKVEE